MVLATLLALLFFAFPVYWMFATAFKPTNDILSYTPHWLPVPFTLEHFSAAVHRPNFGYYLRNSLMVTVSAVLASLLFAVLAKG
jgi:N,N'-diacetylchitobiose transport system permease protein